MPRAKRSTRSFGEGGVKLATRSAVVRLALAKRLLPTRPLPGRHLPLANGNSILPTVSEIGYRQIVHVESGRTLVKRARWCDSFASKLRGFTFRRELVSGEGLVLVEKSESRIGTSIHMFFVFFELGVIWVNAAGEVVDTALARPWRPSYAPQAPALYVVEAGPGVLQSIGIGDHLNFGDSL